MTLNELRRREQGIEEPFLCPGCGATCQSREALTRHDCGEVLRAQIQERERQMGFPPGSHDAFSAAILIAAFGVFVLLAVLARACA